MKGPAPQTVEQIRSLVRGTAFQGVGADSDEDADAECFSRPPAKPAGGRTNSFAPAKPAAAKPAAVTLVPTKAPIGDGAKKGVAAVFGLCKALASERAQRNRSCPIDCDAPPVLDLTKPRVRPTESQRSLAPIFAKGGSSRAAPLPPKGKGKKKSVVVKEQPVDCVVRGRDGLNYFVDASGKRTPCDT